MKSFNLTVQMKPIQPLFHIVLFTALYKQVLTVVDYEQSHFPYWVRRAKRAMVENSPTHNCRLEMRVEPLTCVPPPPTSKKSKRLLTVSVCIFCVCGRYSMGLIKLNLFGSSSLGTIFFRYFAKWKLWIFCEFWFSALFIRSERVSNCSLISKSLSAL